MFRVFQGLWRRFGVLLRGIVRQKREDVYYPQRVKGIQQFQFCMSPQEYADERTSNVSVAKAAVWVAFAKSPAAILNPGG